MVVVVKDPKGIVPRLEPTNLPDGCATIAQNVNLKGGTLAPLYAPLYTATLPDALRKTIYKYDVTGPALYGGTAGTLAAFVAVHSGSLTVTIGGTAYTIDAMDFSACTTYYEVATVIQTAIREQAGGYTSCTWDATNSRFIISTTAATLTGLTYSASTVYTNSDLMPTMTGAAAPSGTASASTEYSAGNNFAWKAANDAVAVPADGWLANPATFPSWWQYKFTKKYVVNQFRMYKRSQQGFPKNFILKGSNDGSTWTSIQSYTNAMFTNNTWTSYFTVSTANQHAYQYYRVHVTDSDNDASYCNMFEIEFNHTPVNIIGATYLNMSAVAPSTNTATDWLSWTDDHVNVVANPEAGDLYRRIYWTGETGGKMKVKGTAPLDTARDVGITAPAEKAVTFTDTGDWVGLAGHTLTNGTPVQFRTITTTTGISVLTTYYVVNTAADQFKVAATVGGAALPLTTNGTGTLALMSIPVDNYTESWACDFYFAALASPDTPIGSTTSCVLISALATESGYLLTFNFQGAVSGASLTDRNYEFRLTMNNGIAASITKLKSNIGDKTAMTDANGYTWGYAELTQIEAYPTVTYTGVAPTMIGTATEATVTMVLNMNYAYPSITDTAYLVRYINDVGKASPNSVVTTVVTKQSTDKMVLSGIPYVADATIDWIEIYRIVGSGTDAMYKYVTRVANDDTPGTGAFSVEDWVTDTNLGAEIVSVTNPPDNLLGLVTMPNGIGVAFIDRTLYFSELPSIGNGIESWPDRYRKPVQNTIKGLMVTGTEVIVLSEGTPRMVTGTDPLYMRVMDLPSTQACTAHRSISKVGNSVMYSSGDGMARVTGASSTNSTKDFIQKKQWEDLHPELMTASVFDDRLHAFLADSTYLFEPVDGVKALTTSTELATGSYTDLKDDTLYIIQGSDVTAWNRDYATPLLMTWRSKQYEYARPVSWNCVKVVAQSYPTTNPILFKCYANSSLVSTTTITSDAGIRLPITRRERNWMFEIVSYVEVHAFVVAQSSSELSQIRW